MEKLEQKIFWLLGIVSGDHSFNRLDRTQHDFEHPRIVLGQRMILRGPIISAAVVVQEELRGQTAYPSVPSSSLSYAASSASYSFNPNSVVCLYMIILVYMGVQKLQQIFSGSFFSNFLVRLGPDIKPMHIIVVTSVA